LPVSSDLSSNINEALRESRYLIVICSPHSAQSRWVGEEIKTYKKLGREDRILALIVDGEPNASDGKPGFSAEDECFSQALRYRWSGDGEALRSEPIAADVREDKDGKLNAKLKLLAGLLGVNYDDLKRREQERRIRRLRIVVAVTLALVSGFGILSVYAWRQKQAAESALAQTRQTLSQSDYLQALRAIEENRVPDALAQLARSLVLNPDNQAALCRLTTLLAYGGFDIPVLRFKHHEAVLFAQFSPDAKRIVTASRDGTAVVWDAKSGKALTPALKHDQIVWFAQFSPDSARVLTVSDQAARIWNVSDGKPVIEPLRQKLITSAQFSPDGRSLASAAGGELGAVRVLPVFWLSADLGRVRIGISDSRVAAAVRPRPRRLDHRGPVGRPYRGGAASSFRAPGPHPHPHDHGVRARPAIGL
jgi:cell division protein FtsB